MDQAQHILSLVSQIFGEVIDPLQQSVGQESAPDYGGMTREQFAGQEKYKDKSFIYKVRGKDIEVQNYSESLSGLKIYSRSYSTSLPTKPSVLSSVYCPKFALN